MQEKEKEMRQMWRRTEAKKVGGSRAKGHRDIIGTMLRLDICRV